MSKTGLKVGGRSALGVLLLGAGLLATAMRGGTETDPPEARRIRQLRAEIARHDALYFRASAPEITDAEYDRLKRELRQLEEAHPGLATAPTGPADDRTGHFPTGMHRQRMLGLEKAYGEADWVRFHSALVRRVGPAPRTFVVEPKYDGLAVSLTYEDGRLARILTRGNGDEGDDVTQNRRLLPDVPVRLAGDIRPAVVELHAEVYLTWSEFARINAASVARGDEPFAHPRNLAAGTLKSTDPIAPGERRLSVVIHGWGAWEGAAVPPSYRAFQAQVRAWGLPVVTGSRAAGSREAAWTAVQALGDARAHLPFPTDGAVVKLDDTAGRDAAGAGPAAPRWAIACKFEPERAVTRLRAIRIQVGRTGLLTPVADFDAVELGGATIMRATLHNREVIARRDIRVGDFVEVERAGEVIPAIVAVQRSRRAPGTKPFAFPEKCPSCATPVEAGAESAVVRCPNLRCPAQRLRRLEHFASADAVGLKGLGPAVAGALIRSGAVQSPSDLYRLETPALGRAAGLKEAATSRLAAEIAGSRDAELWRFIHGLSIPQIGAATARKVAAASGDLAGFARLDPARLAGSIGPAAAASLRRFLARSESQAEIRALLGAGVNPRSGPGVAPAAHLRGRSFAFTGTLPGLTRTEATRRVREAGGAVSTGVSRDVDFLVVGTAPGSKLAEARRLGVRILDADEFKALLDPD